MALALDHLRGEVVWGATEGVGLVAELHGILCETDVGDAHVALRVQEHILWLQVAVDDLQHVKVMQGGADFTGVQLGLGLGKAPGLLQVVE